MRRGVIGQNPQVRFGFLTSTSSFCFTTNTWASHALTAGTFDARSDRHVSRVRLVLDEEGWEKLMEIFGETLESVFQVQAESANRLAKDDKAEGISALTTLLAFEMPDADRETG